VANALDDLFFIGGPRMLDSKNLRQLGQFGPNTQYTRFQKADAAQEQEHPRGEAPCADTTPAFV
jgi:hypothetical protein